MSDLVDLKTAAKHFNYNPESFRKLVKSSDLPHYRPGGKLLFDLEELKNAMRVGNNKPECESVKNGAEPKCHSSNNATQKTGTVNLQHQTEASYIDLLGL